MAHLKQIIAVGILGITLILGALAYNVFKTPATASGPIEAIPLVASATQSSTSGAAASTAAADTTAADAQPTAAATSGAATSTAAADATAADAQPTAAATSGDTALSADSTIFQIDQGETEARFIIDEVLNNTPRTVVGTTDQVAGQIAIDPQDPTQTRVGVIRINARTLTTDNDFRNRAIKNQILQTDAYEFITFTPTQIVGLPESGTVGEAYSFRMVGDLTIGEVTKQMTFDVTATAATESRVEGTATATIDYADYGISIPHVPQVASVADQVQLQLDFVAVPA